MKNTNEHTKILKKILSFDYRLYSAVVLVSFAFQTAQSQELLAFGNNSTAKYLGAVTDTDVIINHSDTGFIREDEFYFDEVLLTLNITRIGSFEIDAIIYNELAYLPVHALFDFLKIKNITSRYLDSISGFYIHPDSRYLIDKGKNKIEFEGKIFTLQSKDIIRTERDLFLRTDFFGKVFGLNCVFNFRSLAVFVDSKVELPAIREMKQAAMRNNVNRFRGERKADSTIGKKFSLIHLGMADWTIVTTQDKNGENRTRAALNLGAMIAGGETNIYLNYNSNILPSFANQYFRWRHVNNDGRIVKQIVAGRINSNSISTIFKPVTGIQLTNTPSVNRRSFGSYTLSDNTEPGWTVELYLNDVLIDYTISDASGFFTFEVPLVYGNTQVKLRYYGPWGEDRTEEQVISIPFNFVPHKKFEYNFSAGIVGDDPDKRYARAVFNYGLSRWISIGGGNEYLSSNVSGKNIPFLNASLRIGPNLFLTGEHSYGVRSKLILNAKLPSNLRLDIDYVMYQKGQQAIRLNYIEERKAVLSMPVRMRSMKGFARLTFNQYILPYNINNSLKQVSKYSSSEFLISASVKGIGANFTTNAVLIENENPHVYSNLALTFRLPNGFLFRPQVQFDFRKDNFGMVKGELEKYFSYNGFLNIFYEKNFVFNTTVFGLGLRYNFSFAQISFSARKNKKDISLTQSASGSLLYNENSGNFLASHISQLGRGAVVVLPFLDMNCNGQRDDGEPKASGLKLKINGGRIVRNEYDTTISILGLEPYNAYYLELDKNSFDNIAWQMKSRVIKFSGEPNYFQAIEVPVAVVGEVSGTVFLRNEQGTKGLGRIIINIYNSDSVLVAKTLSESDGFFSYIGLAPGSYTAQIDEEQLQKINMNSQIPFVPFSIKKGRDGDIADGLGFILFKK